MAKINKTAPKAQDRKAILAVTPADGKRAMLAIAKAANAHSKANVTVLETLAAQVKTFGPMTGEQWDAFVKPLLLEALKAQPTVTAPENYASKFKAAGLALASELPEFKAGFGETLKAYLDRTREPLRTAKLADGRTIFPVAADGSAKATKGRKPMTAKAKADAAKARDAAKLTDAAKTSAGVSRDAEGGHDVSRYHALAVSLMGSEDAGKRLLAILKDHRKAFDAWSRETLERAEEAANVSKAVLATMPLKGAKPNGATPPN